MTHYHLTLYYLTGLLYYLRKPPLKNKYPGCFAQLDHWPSTFFQLVVYPTEQNSQGIAFQGRNESGDSLNKDHFQELVDLIDPTFNLSKPAGLKLVPD
jgi:hypothetical protein